MRFTKWIALAVTAAVTGGAALAAVPAHAATPSCGSQCVTLWSPQWGKKFVLDDYRQGQRQGQPAILFRESNADPAEDWTYTFTGTVASIFASDPALVSQAMLIHYGADTGLCLGTAVTAGAGTPVSLQPCGVSSKTLWVTVKEGARWLLINGSDTSFSHPSVLAYPGADSPSSIPRTQLVTEPEKTFSDGTIYDSELWGSIVGTLP